MSLRQQIKYLVESSAKKSALENEKITQDTICELRDYIQDEEIRKRHPNIGKLEERNRLIDEAQRLFKPIRKTIYLERKHAKLSIEEIMICNCKPPREIKTGDYEGLLTIGCGRRCLNRIVSTECCASFCPSEDRCTNRRFQLQQHSQVYPIKTAERGWGLAAGQPISKGQFIIQYVGEVYNINSDLGRARQIRYRSSPCTYLMSIFHNEVIDPTRKGNLARFMNHSCDPNCETQKWNVMGEICIGIFARRNIEEDEELTFDYRFDTHKTKFTKCFCGASNCRIYLGLVRMPEEGVEENDEDEESSDNLKCHLCETKKDDLDFSLIFCDSCNKGFHEKCLEKPLDSLAKFWLCDKCEKSKPETVVEEENDEQETIQLEKYQFEFLRQHLLDINEFGVKIFWDTSFDNSSISVHIRGANADKARNCIENILVNSAEVQKIEDRIICIEIKVQNILFSLAYKFCSNITAEFHLEQKDVVKDDEIYPLNQTSSFFLTGRSLTVYGVAEKVLDYIDHLFISTLTITQTEAKKIESDILSLRNMVYPAEIRLSKEKTLNYSTHPYFSNQFEERKLVYIGKEEDIQLANRTLNCWLSERMGSERETHYSFLLPPKVKNLVKRYKTEALEHMKNLNPQIAPNIIIHDPNLSKKLITISVTGSWSQIMRAKQGFIQEINQMSEYNELDIFFSFTYSQIYRAILRGIVKYMHSYENQKKSAKKLQPLFKFWDLYSAELTLPDIPTSPIDKFRAQVVSHFIQDTELLLYTLRLSESYKQIQNILKSTFKVSSEEAIQKFDSFVETFPSPDPKKKLTYSDQDFNVLNNFLIDEEDVLEMDLDQIVIRALDQSRILKRKQKFLFFPLSFGTDIENNDWEPDINSKLISYLKNLEDREILLGTEQPTSQIVTHTPVLFDAKEKADVMVGCFEANNNVLYVIFADSE